MEKKHSIFGGKVILDIPGLTEEGAKKWERDIAKKANDMGGVIRSTMKIAEGNRDEEWEEYLDPGDDGGTEFHRRPCS